jgi:isocitrate/isopropylmalate dehydrogenase
MKLFFLYSLEEHATVIRKAIVSTISVRNVKTIDIGGNATTSEFMKHILEEIQKQTPEVGLKSNFQ